MVTGKNADETEENDHQALQTSNVADNNNSIIKPSMKDGMTQVDEMLP